MSNKKILTIMLLIPMSLTTLFFATPQQQKSHFQVAFAESFSDIREGDKYFSAINYLREQGLINGYEDGTFQANKAISRAEALKMLTIASGLFIPDQFNESEMGSEEIFADVFATDWYAPYLKEAKNRNIINGYSDGSFKPNANINLAETLKIYFESSSNIDYGNTAETLFNDTPKDAWFGKYTSFAGENGIINIYSDNRVNPEQEMTRGYMAEIIYRMELYKQGYLFGKATWYGGISDGDNLTTAHKTLPFGTIVEVTNLSNNKSIQVKVNDRGPFGPGRVLDLSKSAFGQIADPSTGVITVQYKVVIPPQE